MHLKGIFAYRAPGWRKLATCKHFFFKTNLFNEEINCTTNEGKTAKNEWENDDPDFLQALHSIYNLYIKCIVNLFQER